MVILVLRQQIDVLRSNFPKSFVFGTLDQLVDGIQRSVPSNSLQRRTLPGYGWDSSVRLLPLVFFGLFRGLPRIHAKLLKFGIRHGQPAGPRLALPAEKLLPALAVATRGQRIYGASR
jgi:hypothetical protein